MIGRLGKLTSAQRVRRNHALEHATITIISERHSWQLLAGRSNRKGFYIFGEVDTEELRSAVDEALRRLQGGEAELAIHPRCGTNLAIAGILSGITAVLAAQLKPRQNRFSYAILASLASLMVAPRLGTVTQRHLTTLADLTGLKVETVEPKRLPYMRVPAHWVKTRSS